MKKYLFDVCESSSFTPIQETNKPLKIGGVFQRSDVENGNGRIYSFSLWEKTLNETYVKTALRDRTMLGQLGHPSDPDSDILHPSHIVTKLELQKDGTVYGEAEILDTPEGKLLKTLYEAGVKIGISSRGYIPDEDDFIMREGKYYLPDSYLLETFDFVLQPSTPGANPRILESSKNQLRKVINENRDKMDPSLIKTISSKFLGVSENTKSSTKKSAVAAESSTTSRNKVSTLFRDNSSAMPEQKITTLPKGERMFFMLKKEEKLRKLREAKLLEKVQQLILQYTILEEVVNGFKLKDKISLEVIKEMKLRLQKTNKQLEAFKTKANTSLKNERKVAELLKRLYGKSKQLEGKIELLKHGLAYASTKAILLREDKDALELKEKMLCTALEGLKDNVLLSEKVIYSMKDRLEEQNKKIFSMQAKVRPFLENAKLSEREALALSESFGVSVSEVKKIFKQVGESKHALKFHLKERQKLTKESYSEYPYMRHAEETQKVVQRVEESFSDEKQVPLTNVMERLFR